MIIDDFNRYNQIDEAFSFGEIGEINAFPLAYSADLYNLNLGEISIDTTKNEQIFESFNNLDRHIVNEEIRNKVFLNNDNFIGKEYALNDESITNGGNVYNSYNSYASYDSNGITAGGERLYANENASENANANAFTDTDKFAAMPITPIAHTAPNDPNSGITLGMPVTLNLNAYNEVKADTPDIDLVVTRLTQRLSEAVTLAAESVHL